MRHALTLAILLVVFLGGSVYADEPSEFPIRFDARADFGTVTVRIEQPGLSELEAPSQVWIADEQSHGREAVVDMFLRGTIDVGLLEVSPNSACDDFVDCATAIRAACDAIGSTPRTLIFAELKKSCEGKCANGTRVETVCPKP